ncbi:MAG: PQQ-dependent sugar dehydrogenase [Saprospiraceae bacterium]
MLKQLSCLPLLVFTAVLSAQPKIELVSHATGFTRPVDIAHCGDSRLFVVEQRGYIWVLDSAGNRLPTPFLNIDPRVRSNGNEQGLLGLAFPPDFAQTGIFYLNYTRETDGDTRVSRFSLLPGNANEADPNSEEILLEVNQPYTNHNGGCLKFGPDGYLYVSLGDGGSGGDPQNNGQTKKSLLGKILRLDVSGTSPGLQYAIPSDNPFVNDTTFSPEIWSWGLRNPWRFSFDRQTGDMWIGDVGQVAREEIDFEPAGAGGRNYGWRCYEGTSPYNTDGCQPSSAYTGPVFDYANPGLGRSVTGGFIYRGTQYADLQDFYLFADYVSGRWWATRQGPDGTFSTALIGQFAANQYSTYGEDRDGELYVAALAQGVIYKVKELCSAFQLSATVTDASCPAGMLNGIIDLNIVGGLAPYTLLWNNGQTDSLIIYLDPGSYSVLATDARGCARRDTFVVGYLESPPLGLALVLSNGTLGITSGTWAGYQWFLNGMPIAGATNPTFVPVQDGFYECLLVSSGGCKYKPGLLVTVVSTALPTSVASFSLAPNPTSSAIRVSMELRQSERINMAILDAGQSRVFSKQLHGQRIEEEIDLGYLPAGTYYLVVEMPSGSLVRPVVRK